MSSYFLQKWQETEEYKRGKFYVYHTVAKGIFSAWDYNGDGMGQAYQQSGEIQTGNCRYGEKLIGIKGVR